jgi:hypothetical protein
VVQILNLLHHIVAPQLAIVFQIAPLLKHMALMMMDAIVNHQMNAGLEYARAMSVCPIVQYLEG